MTRRTTFAVFTAALSLTCSVPKFVHAEDPAATPPATRPGVKGELGDHFHDLNVQWVAMFPKSVDLADRDRVAKHAAEAIPVAKGRLEELVAFIGAHPSYAAGWNSYMDECKAQLVIVGDADTKAALDADAKTTGEAADRAQRILLWSQWLLAGRDAAGQQALLPKWEAMANAAPADNEMARILITLTGESATPEIGEQLAGMVKPMTSIAANQFTLKQTALAKRKQGEGKPMVIAGKTPDGKVFTTSDWRGKVILVDVWAVWCGPCVAELPRVKKAYAAYHDKGLEVLGVSNDYTAGSLTGFTAKEGMPWPQLFDAEAAAEKSWNPITTGFGISGIPAMFLIDKKGVCRTVTARENFEELIPKLLAE